MNMSKMFFNTLKWETISCWIHFRWPLFGIILVAAMMMILQTIGLQTDELITTGLIATLLSLAIFAGLFYAIFIFPSAYPVYDLWADYAISDRLINRPFAMLLGIRLFIGIIIHLLALGILFVLQYWLNIGLFIELPLHDFGFPLLTLNLALFWPIMLVYGSLVWNSYDFFSIPKMAALCSLGLLYAINQITINNQNLLPVNPLALNLVLFFVMFALSCWLYEKKMA